MQFVSLLNKYYCNKIAQYTRNSFRSVCLCWGAISSTALWAIIISTSESFILERVLEWGGWRVSLISPADQSLQFSVTPLTPCWKMTYGDEFMTQNASHSLTGHLGQTGLAWMSGCLFSPRNDKLYIHHSCQIGGQSWNTVKDNTYIFTHTATSLKLPNNKVNQDILWILRVVFEEVLSVT